MKKILRTRTDVDAQVKAWNRPPLDGGYVMSTVLALLAHQTEATRETEAIPIGADTIEAYARMLWEHTAGRGSWAGMSPRARRDWCSDIRFVLTAFVARAMSDGAINKMALGLDWLREDAEKGLHAALAYACTDLPTPAARIKDAARALLDARTKLHEAIAYAASRPANGQQIAADLAEIAARQEERKAAAVLKTLLSPPGEDI